MTHTGTATARFTATSPAKSVFCAGRNHHDSGRAGTCTGCGADVARREDGRVFTLTERYTVSDALRLDFVCWVPQHVCDPARAAAHAAQVAAELAAGVLRRGARVIVVKGRKVAKGTTGEVFWIGDSDYGQRVGFTDDSQEGTSHFTAVTNVEVVV